MVICGKNVWWNMLLLFECKVLGVELIKLLGMLYFGWRDYIILLQQSLWVLIEEGIYNRIVVVLGFNNYFDLFIGLRVLYC